MTWIELLPRAVFAVLLAISAYKFGYARGFNRSLLMQIQIKIHRIQKGDDENE